MTKGIPKKRQRNDQLRKKRAQAASALATGALKPPKAIPIAAAQRSRPAGVVEAMPEPLPAHSYPTKRAQLGKPQTAVDR